MEEAKLMTNCIWRNVFVDIMDKLKEALNMCSHSDELGKPS